MPTDLSRSLLTILIPGLIAIAPWLLLVVQRTNATLGFGEYPTIANALVFSCVVVVGSFCEGMGTLIESRWDTMRCKTLDVYGDWYAYLASTESPVGNRYLSRLVTSMYFELSMFFAVPPFIAGCTYLGILRFPELNNLILGAGAITILLSLRYFWWQAYRTHDALCVTRQKLRELSKKTPGLPEPQV